MQTLRALPILFVFGGLLTAIHQLANTYVEEFSFVRNIFLQTMMQTRVQLVSTMHHALDDEQVLQNFKDKNFNSAAQSLQNYVLLGELSQLELLDGDCNLLFRVPSNTRPLLGGCHQDLQNKTQVTWLHEENGEGTLRVAIPQLIDGKYFTAVGFVSLDSAWLTLHPKLSHLISSKKYSLQSASPAGRLAAVGFNLQGNAGVSINMAGWLGKIMPDFSRFSLTPWTHSFWFLYFMFGGYLTIIALQYGLKQRVDAENRQQSLTWLRSKRKKDEKILDKSKGDKKTPEDSWPSIIRGYQRLVELNEEKNHQKIKLLKERLEHSSCSAIERERTISALKDELSEMAELASLKEQLKHSTTSFLQKMDDARDICETIFDVISTGLATQGKTLHEFYTKWRDGIADEGHRERGARKFFRTLSETKSTEYPGKSLLDVDLAILGTATGATLDQTLHVTMLARQALAHVESGAKIAALWHGLALGDEGHGEKTVIWSDCFLSAQNLLLTDVRYAMLSFEGLPKIEDPQLVYPVITKAGLVSGVFHIYLALLSTSNPASLDMPIMLKQKCSLGQGLIAISLPQIVEDFEFEEPTAHNKANYHLDIAKAILGSLGIKVSLMPATEYGRPIALSWKLPDQQVEVVTEEQTILQLNATLA